jgi:hypothetical protein
MQRLGKHVPAATDTHTAIEVLLESGFSTVVRAEEKEKRQLEVSRRSEGDLRA